MVAPSVATDKVLVGTSTTGGKFMAIHLTPTELAREAGLQRRGVSSKCMELGVAIFQGRIDKTLVLCSFEESQRRTRTKASRPSRTAPLRRLALLQAANLFHRA